ncbi:MAG: hypothetical protein ALECFALPRED_000989 [Alectoria fallacina]|uniref:Pre-mRNA splicing factor CLF1 n=1 Tax=Alectoria fallacina TaxID=1903189 RepID=A0A8H3JB09_9LECA|nr:MAG: hypothetical protein ALECFALPRED_000989 [Alectoria fallacina]
MVVPVPPVPLNGHCSIIYNGVLYTYQANAFQSLALQDGATWTQLPMGVPTNGSTCVEGTYNNDTSLIIVGGSTSNSNYHGIQSFSFSTKTWTSQDPLDAVALNRVDHGTAYLQQSSSILMYAGTQNNNYGPSSQTFLIQTTSPYNVQAFNSIAPPVVSPLVLPFNTTHALMLGGDPTNTKLFTFGPEEGWQQLNVSLQNGLRDSSMVQATILDGSDGSKVLEIFDFSTSPNQISTLLLQNATNTPSSTKRSYSRSVHHPAKRRKRDTTLADRPAYNNTLAPQETRTGYSLAEDPKTGLVVASGGSSQDPLAIFNQTGNEWVDPNQFFGSEAAPSSTSSTPNTAATGATGTTASSTTSPSQQAANTTVRNKSLTILGGVLGGVFGLAALLVILLLLLRYCRRRRDKKRQQQANSYALEDKAEMDFRDVGVDFMKEAGGNFDESKHKRNKSDKSGASGNANAKAQERGGAASSQSKRALLHHPGDSAGSAHSFWSRRSPEKSPPTISAPIMGPPIEETLRTSPDPRTDPRTDTGWSRYFTNNNSKELNSMPLGNDQETRPQTYFSGESEYNSSNPHESAEVEPLNIRASQNPSLYPPNSRVMSPTGFPRPSQGVGITHSAGLDPRDEASPRSTLVSDIDEEDEYARHSHSDGQDSWTPVASIGERGSTWTEDRPVSDYANSGVNTDSRVPIDSRANSRIYPHPGERVKIPNFPTVPNSQGPSGVNSPTTSPVDDPNRGLRNVASRDFARTASGRRIPNNASVATYSAAQIRERAVPEESTGRLPEYGSAQVRTYPRKKEELGPRGRGGRETEDMSWLNLGTSAEQSNNHLRFANY